MALMSDLDPYQTAFIDWLACACAGRTEPAALAVGASGDDLLSRVAFAATAGHVLDFDDTFSPGVAHVSAVCAPAALVLAGHLGLSLGAALEAYTQGFEAMAAVAAASHPTLYEGGWHPTTVCGPVGAVVAATHLLGLSVVQREHALALALLRTGGTRGAFGSDGKAIQVGLTAAAGVQAALLARDGATVDPRAIHGPVGFRAVFGAGWPAADIWDIAAGDGDRAVERTWIKLHPSCLGTHSPIEATESARGTGYRLEDGELEVRVHPVARQAAYLDVAHDGLSAKFSIPYCVAHTLIHGPPRVRDFVEIDPAARELAGRVQLTTDTSLPEFGAVLAGSRGEIGRVASPAGSPERPLSGAQLADKVADLSGDRLDGALDDQLAPAAGVLDSAGLCRVDRSLGA